MSKTVIFLDGALTCVTAKFLKTISPGILQGCGVFETMRFSDGKVFALDRHLKRLFFGLKYLKITPPFSKSKIKHFLSLTLRENKLRDARIRLSAWKKDRRVRMAIVAEAYGGFAAGDYAKGLCLAVSSLRQNRPPSAVNVKSLRYALYQKAFLNAKAQGCHEAVLLTSRGEVSEGSRSNIFFVKNKTLLTPHLQSGCLKGITRQMILRLAKKLRICCRQVPVTLDDLHSADEIFLTNALKGVMPVSRLTGWDLKLPRGPVTRRLTSAYRKAFKQGIL